MSSSFIPSTGSNLITILYRRSRLLLLAALGLGFSLPLLRFGASFWGDEATSVWFARWPLSQLLRQLCDPHPPLYYVMLKGWLSLGEQEWWARWPSLAASVLAIAFTYYLGKRLRLGAVALLAAILLALHPLQLWYAGEARMYTAAEVMGLLLVLVGWRWIQTGDSLKGQPERELPWGMLYVGVVIIGLGVDYTTFFPLLAVQMLWLASNHPRPLRWLSYQIIALAAAYLLWIDAAHRSALASSFQAFTLAVQLDRLGLNLTPGQATMLLRIGGISIVVVALTLAWQWPKRLYRLRDQKWLAILVLLGWFALLLFMAIPRMYSFKRQLLTLLPYLTLVTAYAMLRLPRSLAGGAVVITFIFALFILPMPQREPWRPLLHELAIRAQEAPVWVDEWAVTPVDYYDRQMHKRSGQGLNWYPLLSRNLPTLPSAQPPPGQELWLVMSEGPYRHLLDLLPPIFFSEYQRLERQEESGAVIYRYQRRPEPLSTPPLLPTPSRFTLWSLETAFPLDVCP